MKEVFKSIDFYLLLLFSFLPGIGKVTEQQFFMIFSVPIIFVLLFFKREHKIVLKKWDGVYMYFLFYIISLCIVQYFNPNTNKLGLFMGLFLDGIPMMGFLYSRKISIELLSKYLSYIAVGHLILGILLYPSFNLHIIPDDLIAKLNEGVMLGRMSSVSGSLGFGALMFMSGVMSFFYNRKLCFLIIIGVIFSAQRSAWLASFFLIFMLLLDNTRKGKVISSLKIGIGLLSVVVVLFVVANLLGIDTSFLLYRFNEIDSGVSERSALWLAGIDNFKSNPLGVGIGQVGQVANKSTLGIYKLVPDGDYFRSLSEYGFGFIIFFISTIIFFLLYLCKGSFNKQVLCILSLMGGIFIQMIGSNVTEFFFISFLIWTIWGFFYDYFNNNFKIIL